MKKINYDLFQKIFLVIAVMALVPLVAILLFKNTFFRFAPKTLLLEIALVSWLVFLISIALLVILTMLTDNTKKTNITLVLVLIFLVFGYIFASLMENSLPSVIIFFVLLAYFGRLTKNYGARAVLLFLFALNTLAYMSSLKQGTSSMLNLLGYMVHEMFPGLYTKMAPYASQHKGTIVTATMIGISVLTLGICAVILFIKMRKSIAPNVDDEDERKQQ